MKFIPLASGSSGNAYLIDDGETRLALECGVTFTKLRKLAGFDLSNIAACFITHEHGDHAKCADKIIQRGVRVYATAGTRDALNNPLINALKSDGRGGYQAFQAGSYDVLPFRVFHDAAEPVGYFIQSRADGDRLIFATDTVNLAYQFPGVTIAAIECNHDDAIVERIHELPERQAKHLKRASNTHMSVSRCCRFLAKIDKSRLREVYLLHLSDAFSNETAFRTAAERVVGPGVRVTVCPKERL